MLLDVLGLLSACSYALDCVEAELVHVSDKHAKRVLVLINHHILRISLVYIHLELGVCGVLCSRRTTKERVATVREEEHSQ